MTSPMTIIDACRDDELFAKWFREPTTWGAWFSFLKAIFSLQLDEQELQIFRECTGRDFPPDDEIREAWLVVGRRGGKSLALALIAAYLGALIDWSPYLTPGERGTIMIIAADRRQARTIFRYVTAMFKETILADLIDRETADALDLTNGVTIEILTASFRTVRGYSLIAALCDEQAFWRSDESGANPDKEIMAAIRPAMASIPASRLLVASSPYARKGELWNAYRRHYGKPGPVLVWKAPTRRMNPTIPESIIAEAMQDDPASAQAEYGAEFRSDVEGFVTREVIDACVVPDRYELPPIEGERYYSFTDPSGGSADSMTLAIAHRNRWTGAAVLDAIREVKPPFSPDAVVIEFCDLLRRYNVRTIQGDRYAGEWPRERFRFHGVTYEVSPKTKSELFLTLLPMLNSGAEVELIANDRLHAQLISLERRTSRSGRDSIDHAPGGHDDIANAVAGALVLAAAGAGRPRVLAISVPPLVPSFARPMDMDRIRDAIVCDGSAMRGGS